MVLVLRRRTIGNDDFAMFLGYAFAIAFTIASYVSIRWGVGLELENVPPFWARRAIQAIYVNEIFYYFAMFCVKISIMFMYLRLGRSCHDFCEVNCTDSESQRKSCGTTSTTAALP